MCIRDRDKETGKPVYNAVVWQCARAEELCRNLQGDPRAALVPEKTGLNLSPYFSAAKLAWILQNIPEATRLMKNKRLCCGTIDSWLLWKLTGGTSFKTDYSNASRTELFNINTLCWDKELCSLFGVDADVLPQPCPSDSLFGETTFEGLFPRPVPIRGILGDSHGALFAQGCLEPGMAKATYLSLIHIYMCIRDRSKASFTSDPIKEEMSRINLTQQGIRPPTDI